MKISCSVSAFMRLVAENYNNCLDITERGEQQFSKLRFIICKASVIIFLLSSKL